MKRISACLVILFALLQYRLWSGENSLREYFGLQKQIQAQKLSNEKLIARNQILKEEIADLKGGTEALEERARNELGLVKEGETFYRVVTGKKQNRFPESQ
ncbi:cell division protein FtsB [Parashewanella spongiae]|uniref:Cell division protein FtsB n=1 Tax=Parashewanella spongiae TaxID=342950 RepID=A0A3A6TYM3_9GAMM|nr:cell division protein FtsB [Parashewanella spongiae]MCL1077799.1 cell division protein FtsB [Parashewanella spongiae]RJY18024.1 cell division protein FtsB [Parashewanella spongiae]